MAAPLVLALGVGCLTHGSSSHAKCQRTLGREFRRHQFQYSIHSQQPSRWQSYMTEIAAEVNVSLDIHVAFDPMIHNKIQLLP